MYLKNSEPKKKLENQNKKDYKFVSTCLRNTPVMNQKLSSITAEHKNEGEKGKKN